MLNPCWWYVCLHFFSSPLFFFRRNHQRWLLRFGQLCGQSSIYSPRNGRMSPPPKKHESFLQNERFVCQPWIFCVYVRFLFFWDVYKIASGDDDGRESSVDSEGVGIWGKSLRFPMIYGLMSPKKDLKKWSLNEGVITVFPCPYDPCMVHLPAYTFTIKIK